jgi:hypothetical protein
MEIIRRAVRSGVLSAAIFVRQKVRAVQQTHKRQV